MLLHILFSPCMIIWGTVLDSGDKQGTKLWPRLKKFPSHRDRCINRQLSYDRVGSPAPQAHQVCSSHFLPFHKSGRNSPRFWLGFTTPSVWALPGTSQGDRVTSMLEFLSSVSRWGDRSFWIHKRIWEEVSGEGERPGCLYQCMFMAARALGWLLGEFIGYMALRSRLTIWLPLWWGFLMVQFQTPANGVGWFLFNKNLGFGPEKVK